MRYLTIAVIFVALLTLTLWQAPFASSATLDQIRLSWQHDPKTTITVMWRTEGNLAPRVQYGTTTGYGSEAIGTTQPAVLEGYFYNTVELTGLAPDTTYHYRVSGDTDAWGNDNTFKTAPSGPADFSFTVFADNGINANATRFADPIKDLVAAQNPAFHLIAGDLTYADGDRCDGQPCIKEHWEQWFTEMARISAKTPVMPALGNHERSGDVKFTSGELFYTRSFSLPTQNREEYYSFDYGDIHFIALNSDDEGSLRAGQSQYEWLRADLAATTKRWKIVYLHHMVYASTSGHSVRERTQTNLSPLFDQYDVDLVLQGHNHNYERTLPIRFGAYQNPVIATTERTNYVNPDGTIYVTTGGAGQGLASFSGTPATWSAVQCKCHQILRVDVDDAGVLTIRSIGADGTTIVDQFTISKTGAVVTLPPIATAPTPQPTPTPSLTPITSSQPATLLTYVPNTQTIRGFNFAVWSGDILERDSTRRSIDALALTGANYFGLAPFWYQDNKNSTVIYRRDSKTATDASVRSAIRYAKSIGLKIALKPMVDSRDGVWRGEFQPSNPDAWFQSYKDFILNYARIAKDENADYLIIGTEFTKLTKPQYSQKWRDLISDIRAVYSGPLTYAANWGKRTDGEYYQIDFWDALDSIGIDAYFPLSENNTPTVQSITGAWTSINSGGAQNWFQDIKALHDRFDKPVILTETGYLSCDGAGKQPWSYPCGTTLDLQEQADLYEGTLTFWKDYDWMLGFLWWRWDADPSKGGTSDKDYLTAGKPVIDVLKRFWLISAPASSNPAPISPAAIIAPAPSPSVTPTPSAGGGGGSGIPPPISSAPTFPQNTGNSTANQNSSILRESLVTHSRSVPFAYGKPRIAYPAQERAQAWELSLALRKIFHGTVPIQKKYWHFYVNAYIYGGYSPAVIARSLRLGGKVVHPSIPWTAWRRSVDYKRYMR